MFQPICVIALHTALLINGLITIDLLTFPTLYHLKTTNTG
jgi:hypothetical protein